MWWTCWPSAMASSTRGIQHISVVYGLLAFALRERALHGCHTARKIAVYGATVDKRSVIRLIIHNPSVATLREGQRRRATGGRNPMDWVATFLRIAWQLCRGLGGNFPADWVAEFRGIRNLSSERDA